MKRLLLILAAALVAVVGAPLASASFLVDRNVSAVSLRIADGRAIVDYSDAGHARHAILWGAIGARQPNPSSPQVEFKVRYGVGRVPGGVCLPYDGPPLPLLVAACKAPDGSYWALQSWQRLLPNYGGTQAPWELHASHWRGPLPELEVWLDWSYGGRFQHLFGRLTYQGVGVHGFRSTSQGNPLDGYGRNVYVDTLDSHYGTGWHRENGFLTHGPGGTFCYGFYPHAGHPSGAGAAYRVTVLGPGVTPIVRWQGEAPSAYDPAQDRELNAIERSLGDPKCRQG
ncbi:MAG TPA: hypothetical protein VE995_09270 [Gaiellaceae bacterium]|nr:hypothetical protein [Gaiellaceae bacterium]